MCVCFGWLNAPAIYIGAFTVHPFTVTSSFCTRNFLLDRTDDDDDDVQSELPIVLWSSVSFKCALLLSFARSLVTSISLKHTIEHSLDERAEKTGVLLVWRLSESECVCLRVRARAFFHVHQDLSVDQNGRALQVQRLQGKISNKLEKNGQKKRRAGTQQHTPTKAEKHGSNYSAVAIFTSMLNV